MDNEKAVNASANGTAQHKLMFDLFYPAVLGALFYNLLPLFWNIVNGSRISEPYIFWKLLFSTLIVFNFSVDFLLAKTVQSYKWVAFVIDVVILLLLFNAFEAINVLKIDEQISVRALCLWYCIMYVCFLVWTIYEKSEHSRLIFLIVFEILAIGWFAFAIWVQPKLWVLAASIFIATLLLLLLVNAAKKESSF